MNKLASIILASASIGGVEAVQSIPSPDQITEIGKLLIQLAIGIITIWKFISEMKKAKKK